jgi:hypothetical protein
VAGEFAQQIAARKPRGQRDALYGSGSGNFARDFEMVLGEVRETDAIANQCSLRSRLRPLPPCDFPPCACKTRGRCLL